MEAPEKLYLIQHNGLICYCRNNDTDIEYTRTDAFIEKACEWLSANLHRCDESIGLSVEEFVERFKKQWGNKL